MSTPNRLGVNKPANKPDDAGSRRKKHTGQRHNAVHIVAAPVRFLDPLLPQTNKRRQERLAAAKRATGYTTSDDDSDDDLVIRLVSKQPAQQPAPSEDKK